MNRTHIAIQLRAIAAHAQYTSERLLKMPETGVGQGMYNVVGKALAHETLIHLRELLDSIERELNRP